jgi:hypothetical protein
MPWLSAVVFLALTVSVCQAQESTEKCTPTYQNHNVVDYGPLVFRSLSGRAIDPNSAGIAGCIGLFSEDGHRLVAATNTDQGGHFAFPAIAPGRYRLVARCDGLCIANVPVRVVRWPHGSHRKLVLHMQPGAVDGCSFGGYK